MALQLFVNTAAATLANALTRSATDLTPVTLPELVVGDQRPYELYFHDGQGNFESWSGSSTYFPYLALGSCGNPSSGTFTATFGANTTAALAWNITPAALQTALQGLASIGANNCTVIGLAGVYYQVTFTGTLGLAAQALIVGNGTLLSPESSVNSSTLVAGNGTTNAVQLLSLTLNPISFASGWTTIANGWTGVMSTATVETVAAIAAASPIATTFQISVVDPSSIKRTYLQQPASVKCTIIQPNAFAGPNVLTYATTAQLAAATLATGIFTQEALSSSAAGNINTGRPTGSHFHTSYVTVTGAAGTRTISVLTTNTPAAGDILQVYLNCPTTAGIILQIYNASTGGTLLKTFTTDTSGNGFHVLMEYSGSAWQIVGGSGGSSMNTSQNLAGLANIVTSRQNIGSLFSTIVPQSANFTATTAQDGALFRVTTGSSSLVATLPGSPSAGYAVILQKFDSGTGSVASSPSTVVLTQQGELAILVYDGSAYSSVIHVGQSVPTPGPLNLNTITGLVGGGTTNLDGLITADGRYPIGTIVVLYWGAELQWWQLNTGTTATDGPNGKVRPADYNSGTNTKFWNRIG